MRQAFRMEQPHEIVTLRRVSSGRYVVTDHGMPLELALARWRPRAEGVVGAQRYRLQRSGILDRGVVVVDAAGDEVLRLSRKHPNVPGLADCQWRVRARWRGYEATLTGADGAAMLVRTGHGNRSDVTAEITATPAHRELLLLAGAFAVLARRREDSEAAVAAATSTAAVAG
jgi:hypothetical protein